MHNKIRPNEDRVLIKRRETEGKTASGIIIPDNAKEKPQIGSVLAVGQGKMGQDGKRITPAVQVGQVVYFGKYAGTELDDDLIMVKADEILGFIEQ
jgi:chaperonin GroES